MQMSHLKYFVETAKCASMRKAAERLFITQSALSSAIATLEGEIGVTLFDRFPRGLLLTVAGREVFDIAVDILELHEKLFEVAAKRSKISGKFKISAMTSMVNTVFADVVSDAAKQYPGIELLIDTSNSFPEESPDKDDHFLYVVCCEEKDKYIAINEVNSIGWNCEPVFTSETFIFVNAKNELSKKDILEVKDLKQLSFVNFQILSHDKKITYCPHNSIKKLFNNKQYTFFTGESALNFIFQHKEFAGPFSIFLAYRNFYIEKKMIKMMRIKDLPLDSYFFLCYPQKEEYSISEKTVLELVRLSIQNYLQKTMHIMK